MSETTTTTKTRARLVAGALATALLLGACVGGPLTSTEEREAPRGDSQGRASASRALPTPNRAYDVENDPIVEVVDRVQPAVVNVTTKVLSRDVIFGGPSGDRSVGTGFVIRSDGVVVTNYHVVEGAVNIKITLPAPDSRTLDARVIGGDSAHDLAILQAEDAKDLPTIPLGESDDLRLGERVIALGYALALEGGPTVTMGIISSLARTVRAQDPNGPEGRPITRTYEDVLQTDAAINPGNSGGPLVDLAGNVVGINTAGAGQAENVGFSIAINAVKPLIERALEDPAAPTAYLGVSTVTVGPGLAVQLGLTVDEGAFVAEVVAGGPAARAGIVAGDVIVAFAGDPVEGSDELGKAILEREPGDRVEVAVVREDGTRETVTATLGTRPLP